MCKVLKVSRSSFYDWLKNDSNSYGKANRQLDVNIKALFNEHKSRYGALRLTKALKALQIKCSKNRVARRMQAMNLKAKARRKFKATTDSNHNLAVFSNVLNRDFAAQKINQKWAGDITYIPTKEGFLYLAVIMDLYSRAIVGWSMSTSLQKDIVCNALTMALFRKIP